MSSHGRTAPRRLLDPVLVSLLCLLPFWASVCASAASVVTSSGPISGAESDDVLVFRGIPYAAPPIGDLRWRPPQPVTPWQSPRDATQFGHRCPQPARADRLETALGATSEDCLYLNVWTAEARGKRPVMVWIHGGAFRVGSGSVPLYDGTQFAQRGIVLVTLNYRLGRFGFFAHPALSAEDPRAPQGNFGLMDQVAALRWVHDNIAAFGGDPGNVTVFGESAGGASVLHLLTSPHATGLFHKAIVESGGGHQIDRRLDAPRGPRESLIAQGTSWAAALGVRDAAALRQLSTAQVLGDGQLAAGLNAVGPVIDGDWVVGDPGVRFAQGDFMHVPILIGANSNEASVLGAFGTDASRVLESLGERAEPIRQLYAGLAHDDAELARIAFGDATFVAGARHVARAAAARSLPVYLYHFDYVLERRRGKVPGAAHGSEIPFVFDSFAQLPALVQALTTDSDATLAATMNRYWINFATSGDPNGEGLPHWPRYSEDGDELLLLAPSIGLCAHLRAQQLDFFQRRWEAAEADR